MAAEMWKTAAQCALAQGYAAHTGVAKHRESGLLFGDSGMIALEVRTFHARPQSRPDYPEGKHVAMLEIKFQIAAGAKKLRRVESSARANRKLNKVND